MPNQPAFHSLFLVCASTLANQATKVPHAENCEWPQCVARCLPCDHSFIGDCSVPQFHNCQESHGPNHCFLGRCVCADGYCPVDKEDGNAFANKCAPRVCVPGARPPKHLESRIAKLFTALSFNQPFPSDLLNYTVLNSTMFHDFYYHHLGRDDLFAEAILWPSVALVCVGVLMSLMVLGSMCCLSVRVNDSEKMHKPSPLPILVVAFITLFISIFLVGVQAYPNLANSFNLIRSELDDAYEDAVTLAEEGAIIRSTSTQLNETLQRVDRSCQFALFLAHLESTYKLVEDYMDLVSNIQATLQSAPDAVEYVKTQFESQRASILYWPLVPTVIVSILCVGIVMEALGVSLFRSSLIAWEADWALRFSSIIFIIVILVATVIASTELASLILLSNFCHNVDEHVLRLVDESWVFGIPYNATRHYVLGEGYNPLSEYIELADRYIFQIADTYERAELRINVTSTLAMCPVTTFIDVKSVAAKAQHVLRSQTGLLSARNIYPYYQKILRQGLCFGILNSIGWILLSQLVVCIVCFPICVILAHRFMLLWFTWESENASEKPKAHHRLPTYTCLEGESDVSSECVSVSDSSRCSLTSRSESSLSTILSRKEYSSRTVRNIIGI